MGLATRCTACGTIFRVVQDQLKVSEGWVRCGRCQEVFNALQNLFDLEREAPPPWPAVPPAESTWGATQPVTRSAVAAALEGADTEQLSTQPLLHRASREPEGGDENGDEGFADARFNEALLNDEVSASDLSVPPALEPAAAEPLPSFVREADRAARWQRPAVRTTLALLLVLSGLALLLQIGVHWRAEFAANWPESRLVLDPVCAALECRIEPPRRIENLAVDSSGLTQLGAPGQFKLSVVLRNRGHGTVMLPAIELSLTDAHGEALVRKVLSAAELGARRDSLDGGAELPLQALLEVSDTRVVGYSVEIFYP